MSNLISRKEFTEITGATQGKSEFLSLLNELNCNKVNADNGCDELFGDDAPFAIVCKKCGSMDIDIIGERGIDYGGQTGYQEGSTAIKCNGCGAAVTAWG